MAGITRGAPGAGETREAAGDDGVARAASRLRLLQTQTLALPGRGMV